MLHVTLLNTRTDTTTEYDAVGTAESALTAAVTLRDAEAARTGDVHLVAGILVDGTDLMEATS